MILINNFYKYICIYCSEGFKAGPWPQVLVGVEGVKPPAGGGGLEGAEPFVKKLVYSFEKNYIASGEMNLALQA